MARKRSLIIFYNDVGYNFFKLLFYVNKKLDEEITISLEDFEIEKGQFISEENMAKKIKTHAVDVGETYLLINSEKVIKNNLVLPKMAHSKAMSLFMKDLKESFDNFKNRYQIYYYENTSHLGYVFNSYLISENLLSSLKKIIKLADLKLKSFNLLSNYAYSKSKLIDKNGCFYYEIDQLSIFSLLNEGKNITFTSCLKDANQISKVFYSDICKHEFEVEKIQIDKIYYSNDDMLSFVGVKKEKLSSSLFSDFYFKGIE